MATGNQVSAKDRKKFSGMNGAQLGDYLMSASPKSANYAFAVQTYVKKRKK